MSLFLRNTPQSTYLGVKGCDISNSPMKAVYQQEVTMGQGHRAILYTSFILATFL